MFRINGDRKRRSLRVALLSSLAAVTLGAAPALAGAAAAGVVTSVALGGAAANANRTQASSNAYPAGVAAGQASATGAIYSTLPGGCAETVALGNPYYHCGAIWLQPAFGANGVYYRSVAAP